MATDERIQKYESKMQKTLDGSNFRAILQSFAHFCI